MFFPDQFNSIMRPTCPACLAERRALKAERNDEKPTPSPKKPKRFKKKKKNRGFVEYRQYMASKQWAIRSSEFKISKGSECEVCGSDSGVSTHHYNYLRLGHERNQDLFCLCESCHGAYHSVFPAKKLPQDDDVSRNLRLRHIQTTVLSVIRKTTRQRD